MQNNKGARMEDMYFLLGYNVCREIERDDEFRTEYYVIGEGWVKDEPGPRYHNLHRTIHDAMFGYGDMSVMDLTDLTEETATTIIAKQEELGIENIPGLIYGGGYVPQEE